MGVKTRILRSGMTAAMHAAQSPKAYATATQFAPFLKNGKTGAILRGTSRNASIETIAGIAELGMHPLIERIGASMLTAIDFAVNQFASSAAVRADVTRVVRNELDERALERQVVRDAAWKGAARGAVSAIPAVIPAAGTGVELAAAVVDQMVRTVAEARMVLAIAHLRGLDVQQVELRRLDILLVLGLSAGAAEIDGDIIRVQNLEISVAELQAGAIPPEAALALGTAVGTDIVSSIAKRRTAGVLLRLLPGGLSVVTAAWYDWRATGNTGKHAVEYFDVVAPLTPASQTARS
jgi:hypothetical protein